MVTVFPVELPLATHPRQVEPQRMHADSPRPIQSAHLELAVIDYYCGVKNLVFAFLIFTPNAGLVR